MSGKSDFMSQDLDEDEEEDDDDDDDDEEDEDEDEGLDRIGEVKGLINLSLTLSGNPHRFHGSAVRVDGDVPPRTSHSPSTIRRSL